MCHKNKIVSVLKSKTVSALKDQSGASLLFVLGVMLMLLAAGASVIAAAFGNFGIGIRQENHNRAMLLGDSIHRNIKYSLVERAGEANSLAQQIAREIYRSRGNMDIIELDVVIRDSSPSPSTIAEYKVTLSFPYASVREINFVAGMSEPFIPTIRETAQLSAAMLVTFEVEVDRAGLLADRRVIIFEAVYLYTGGVLTGPENDPPAVDGSNMVFLTEAHRGSWKMVSFEIIGN